jgi:hypothetical protein
MNVFKYLEQTIVKRGKQVFRHVNWSDNYGSGIVKGNGCNFLRGCLPTKLDLRSYLT